MSSGVYVVAAVYTDRIAGGTIFESLQEMHRFEAIRLTDAALLVKQDDGRLHVVEVANHAIAGGHGSAIKGLVRRIFPRHLTTETADDVSVEQAAELLHDIGVDADELHTLVDGLPPHGALVLAVAEAEWERPIEDALQGYDGRLVRVTLGPQASAVIVAAVNDRQQG